MAVARFNRIFQDANENCSRYRVMLGSAGSGKSVNVAQDYIIKLSDPKYSGCNLLVVRGVEVSHLNSTYAELCGAINRMGLQSVYETKLSPLSITNTITGNTVLFRGCNDQRAIERLKSVTVPNGKITWVWIEEATELRQSDFDILDDRLRGLLPKGHYYQITLTFNPINSGHWIKSKLWDYADADTFCHKSTYLDNKFIDVAYRQRMKRREAQDPEGYKVYGLGEWGETGGLIFTNISIGDYLAGDYEFYTMGTDWGWNHNHATLLIGWKDGEPYIIQEVVCSGKTTAEIIALCEVAGIPRNVQMWCDSAEPDRIKEFQRAGYKAYPVRKEKSGYLKDPQGKTGSVNAQITWLKQRCIHIDGRCIATVKEIQAYKWQKDPKTDLYLDEPVRVDDDCMAALRYGCEPVRKASGLKTINKGELKIW